VKKKKMNTKIIAAILMASMVVAMAVPMAMGGNEATQTAKVYTTTNFEIVAQDGSASVDGWTFSGAASATVDNPKNSANDVQDVSVDGKSVARLKNNNVDFDLKVILNAAAYSNTAIAMVDDESYCVKNVTTKPAALDWDTTLVAGVDEHTDVIITKNTANGYLWLKQTLGSTAGSATSSFSVLAET
jgi:hypothetical protein